LQDRIISIFLTKEARNESEASVGSSVDFRFELCSAGYGG
jgi:hypothetical protein